MPTARDTHPVSQEYVDKSAAFIDAYNRRDFEAAVQDFDPQVDWILPPQQRADSCFGPRNVIRFFEGLDEIFEDLQLLPQEVVDAGDRVATRLRHRARGKASGLEIDAELYHQVMTFRDGVIVRVEYFDNWPAALAAAHAPDETDEAVAPREQTAPRVGQRSE
jgi:ketosteroid isomerase-like protein